MEKKRLSINCVNSLKLYISELYSPKITLQFNHPNFQDWQDFETSYQSFQNQLFAAETPITIYNILKQHIEEIYPIIKRLASFSYYENYENKSLAFTYTFFINIGFLTLQTKENGDLNLFFEDIDDNAEEGTSEDEIFHQKYDRTVEMFSDSEMVAQNFFEITEKTFALMNDYYEGKISDDDYEDFGVLENMLCEGAEFFIDTVNNQKTFKKELNSLNIFNNPKDNQEILNLTRKILEKYKLSGISYDRGYCESIKEYKKKLNLLDKKISKVCNKLGIKEESFGHEYDLFISLTKAEDQDGSVDICFMVFEISTNYIDDDSSVAFENLILHEWIHFMDSLPIFRFLNLYEKSKDDEDTVFDVDLWEKFKRSRNSSDFQDILYYVPEKFVEVQKQWNYILSIIERFTFKALKKNELDFYARQKDFLKIFYYELISPAWVESFGEDLNNNVLFSEEAYIAVCNTILKPNGKYTLIQYLEKQGMFIPNYDQNVLVNRLISDDLAKWKDLLLRFHFKDAHKRGFSRYKRNSINADQKNFQNYLNDAHLEMRAMEDDDFYYSLSCEMLARYFERNVFWINSLWENIKERDDGVYMPLFKDSKFETIKTEFIKRVHINGENALK